MPVCINKMYYCDPGDARSGYFYMVFQINWLAPGAWPHLQELGQQGVGDICFGPSVGHPLKCKGTWRLSSPHVELSSGTPGSEWGKKKKHTKKKKSFL